MVQTASFLRKRKLSSQILLTSATLHRKRESPQSDLENFGLNHVEQVQGGKTTWGKNQPKWSGPYWSKLKWLSLFTICQINGFIAVRTVCAKISEYLSPIYVSLPTSATNERGVEELVSQFFWEEYTRTTPRRSLTSSSEQFKICISINSSLSIGRFLTTHLRIVVDLLTYVNDWE